MNRQSAAQEPLVLSYLGLRKAVGIIGLALPFVLALGKILLQDPGIQDSISAYYYTHMGNVFVGSLCAIGVFLMSCRGYDRRDEIAGYLACVFAIGVALFPTTPRIGATSRDHLMGAVHLSFAALLFLTLAYFSIALFTETAPGKTPTPQKLRRNTVYRICGYTILACIFFVVVVKLPSVNVLVEAFAPVFWLESVAIVAFGVSWLTKGETILKDQEKLPGDQQVLHHRGNYLVRRQRLAPGEATPWHRDPFHRVTVVLSGDLLDIEFRDGGETQPWRIAVGEVNWVEPSDRVHRAVNVGREAFEEVVTFFLDRPDAVPQPEDDSQ